VVRITITSISPLHRANPSSSTRAVSSASTLSTASRFSKHNTAEKTPPRKRKGWRRQATQHRSHSRLFRGAIPTTRRGFLNNSGTGRAYIARTGQHSVLGVGTSGEPLRGR
jgi:hypothetical protein